MWRAHDHDPGGGELGEQRGALGLLGAVLAQPGSDVLEALPAAPATGSGIQQRPVGLVVVGELGQGRALLEGQVGPGDGVADLRALGGLERVDHVAAPGLGHLRDLPGGLAQGREVGERGQLLGRGQALPDVVLGDLAGDALGFGLLGVGLVARTITGTVAAPAAMAPRVRRWPMRTRA